MTKIETYKGYAIAKTWSGWKAVDTDGDMVFISKTKSQVRGGISAIVNGDAWKIEELRSQGYHKL